ncbi:MAG: 6-phosphofructokinase [Gimesia sp.]|uniref:6-phosphofructokinase n=1 Tax=Gimesia sp. TaxID=2024833 RepID=UPI000C5F6F6B|nr:6-phosphofructokinase [Gimesia sp.]MAX36596.1 6-phosphofructokinase [Gimesia sp.]|tara:strand:- start:3238 stop:4650 length:1413 start_codon:yes stop_codon:yes gene_type:complete
MRRIALLTAGGDTPALNATIFGAVERANELRVQVVGIIKGFGGLLDPNVPHIRLNPLYSTLPELDPRCGGTILGSSRTYIDESHAGELQMVKKRLDQLGIEGLICIGGDGTLNGMQPISQFMPCVLAPKTIDNDLGLNYPDEPNEWIREVNPETQKVKFRKMPGKQDLELEDIVNFATPGYATAVYVCVQGVQRIRSTAESHRRIAIIEVMGRESGYLALGAAYGQPDIILIPEIPLDYERFERRVRDLYETQKNVVIVIGEGLRDQDGKRLGDISKSVDPAGNIIFSGAAEVLENMLIESLGDHYFVSRKRHELARQATFTRKIGHTQRGGRPIRFDRHYATQLGGKAVDLLVQRQNNYVAILQWSEQRGFYVSSINGNSLRDAWRGIHPRTLHPAFYDEHRYQPSKLGINYLSRIFVNAIGSDDLELLREDLFDTGHLKTRYQSINVSVHKHIRYLNSDVESENSEQF